MKTKTLKILALALAMIMILGTFSACSEAIPDHTGIQGEKGEKGDKGEQGIQGAQGIQGEQGPQGEQGETGNGIASIEKTNTEGLVDTYTITFTNGDTTTFTVTNGEQNTQGEHLSHDYESSTVYPTCEEAGYTIYTCSCGNSYVNDYVEKIGHSFISYTYNNDASCDTNGTETSICSRDNCEKENTKEKANSAFGHSWGEVNYLWYENQCQALVICENDCSHIETEIVTGTYINDKAATNLESEKGHYEATFKNPKFTTQSLNTTDEYDEIKKNLIATGNGYPKSAATYLTTDSENKKHITLGDITEGGYYIIDTTWIVSDLPTGLQQGKISGLHVERHRSDYDDVAFVKQTGYSITGATVLQYWRFTNVRGEWSQWSVLGTGDIYNNTYNNEIITNVQTNNYTVNVAPTISTNTNNFLASTNNSDDRTFDIIAMLETLGSCQLGPGEFYVSNLHMPAGTTLVGSGYSTVLLLDESVEDGYAIRINSYCTVKDMRISSPTAISLSENIGTRHGIVFQGTYNTDGKSGGQYMSLSNLYIDNFTGGGITCYNTGYSSSSSIGATDVTITKCTVGINISYWSEYHRFTNVYCNNCYYGCINNGGNNMFVNCGFNSNKLGFVIDNTNGDKPNNAHGSAVGCTFNHQNTNDNPGYAIMVINTSTGFVFEGCQIFYGKTLLTNSGGVVFTGCNFGSTEGIEIEGGGSILYNGCMFGSMPKISVTNNNSAYFVNCYLRKGGIVTY